MWGIRAVRVGVLLGMLLVAVAGIGCCHCCESLWGGARPLIPSENQSIAPRDLRSQEEETDGRKTGADADETRVIWGPFRSGYGWEQGGTPKKATEALGRAGRPQQQPTHLTPERIYGGIY